MLSFTETPMIVSAAARNTPSIGLPSQAKTPTTSSDVLEHRQHRAPRAKVQRKRSARYTSCAAGRRRARSGPCRAAPPRGVGPTVSSRIRSAPPPSVGEHGPDPLLLLVADRARCARTRRPARRAGRPRSGSRRRRPRSRARSTGTSCVVENSASRPPVNSTPRLSPRVSDAAAREHQRDPRERQPAPGRAASGRGRGGSASRAPGRGRPSPVSPGAAHPAPVDGEVGERPASRPAPRTATPASPMTSVTPKPRTGPAARKNSRPAASRVVTAESVIADSALRYPGRSAPGSRRRLRRTPPGPARRPARSRRSPARPTAAARQAGQGERGAERDAARRTTPARTSPARGRPARRPAGRRRRGTRP